MRRAAGDVEGLGHLGRVGVVRAGVDLQLGEHLAAEAVLREHPPHGAADGLLRLLGQHLGVGAGLEAARVAGVAVDQLLVGLVEVSTTFSALTMITWSPVSMWGAKVGLCLPRRMRATSVARRPSTRPSASTTCHARVISLALGLYVRTRSVLEGYEVVIRRASARSEGQNYGSPGRHRNSLRRSPARPGGAGHTRGRPAVCLLPVRLTVSTEGMTAATRTAAAAAVLILTLAACGGDDDEGGTADSPTTTAPTSASTTTAPTLPGDLEGRIMFSRFDESTHTFLSTHIAAARRQRGAGAGAPGPEGGGRWSHDGAHIAVMTLTDDDRVGTAIVSPDGTVERVLALPDPTLNLVCTVWSPDDTRLACEGWDDDDPSRAACYAVDASDGGHVQRLTTPETGRSDLPGDYAPDGTTLVFKRTADEDPGPLLLVDLAGGDRGRCRTRRSRTPGGSRRTARPC